MKPEFTCPDCKGHRLEEIQSDVTVASEIINVHQDCLDVGEQTNEGGDIDRFQCVDCGWVIRHMTNPDMEPGKLTLPMPVRDYGVLLKWLTDEESSRSEGE